MDVDEMLDTGVNAIPQKRPYQVRRHWESGRE